MHAFKRAAFVAAIALQLIITPAFATEPAGKVLARLDFTSAGCFHMVHEVLQLIQTGNGVIASISSKEKTEEVTLNALQLRAFRSFATELKALNEEIGCTTESTYVLKTDRELIRKKDDGCSWNGYFQMRKALFNR